MKWFNNLKVGAKVLISCLALILFTVIVSIYSIKIMADANQSFESFYSDRFVPVRELNKMFKNTLQMRINMIQEIQASIEGNKREMEKRFEATQELAKTNEKIWDEYMKTKLTEEEKKLADKFINFDSKMLELRKAFGTALKSGNMALAQENSNNWLTNYRELKNVMDANMQLQQEEGKKLKEQHEENARFALILTIFIMAISIFMGIIITIILSRSVSKPVQKGLDFAKSIAAGDFSIRIDLDQKDELGLLGKALNDSAGNLEMVIKDIVDLSEKLARGDLTGRLNLDKKGEFGMLSKLANSLDTSLNTLEKTVSDTIIAAQNLSQAVEQISSGNQTLSQRTSEQASSLEEVASTIEQATATIRQNADNAVNAKELSDNAFNLAENGGKVLVDAVNSINEINQLGKKIGDIISVINEIAFQTNLLALNAAVEAARAGDQGRGFAVVAGEVRNLAQRAGSSAKEINELIKNSLDKIEIGTSLVNQSGEALKEIIGSASKVAQLISEIASASEEQRQGIDQINIAISDMDTMTQQNAALVEETASASEEMANQSQELLLMMEQFTVNQQLKNEMFMKKHKEVHLSTSLDKARLVRKEKGNGGNGGNIEPGSIVKADEKKTVKHIEKSTEDSMKEAMAQEGFEEF